MAQSDNVRALVIDTDETLWSRYNAHQTEENADKYLPTRLGYVQKAVAQIAGEIYQNQKWLIVPISTDKYNRTLSLIFTPDGIPWHKFLCECYCAGIYKNENQTPVFKTRNNYLMIQWWIIDFWLDRATIIPSPKEKGYQTDDISNNKILFEVEYRSLAHDWIKVKISYDIFLKMINIYKTKNYSEIKNYFYIIIQSFPKFDNTGFGGSILQSDIEMAVKVICDNFLEINNFYDNQQLSKGLSIVTNRIGSWDKNDGMGVFSQ